ncbi:seryl-tRNA synthetase, mitochondrial [Dermacentor variabilis]|uniref:seryl-tRNA synthetase, mitochondrial n=1 Tax=Dermacentor variabilis TaxID=34621 RepID=UPI003F5B7CBC
MLFIRQLLPFARLGKQVFAPARHFREGTHRLFDLDVEFYADFANHDLITKNLTRRGCVADLDEIRTLWEELKVRHKNEQMRIDLLRAIARLPNMTHPDVLGRESDEPVVVDVIGEKRQMDFVPRRFEYLMTRMGLLQADPNYNVMCGERTYFFRGDLARMEQALIDFTVDKLLQKGFTPVYVPDLLHPEHLEACGMLTTGLRNQVYRLRTNWGTEVCLSGTAEMGLANMYRDHCLEMSDLPQRLMAVSRCYRAEISSTKQEKGLYRVHQFNKVEMFGFAPPGQSAELRKEFVEIQKEICRDLNLHVQLSDMPPIDLGLPAYRKLDMEAWMPGSRRYGEISSASDCTDYQSRRLGITCRQTLGEAPSYVFTTNGTACAVPRMLTAIVENYQQKDHSVVIPDALRRYMDDKALMEPYGTERIPRPVPFYFMENR